MIDALPAPPLDNAYWVEPGRLLAGEHPAGGSDEATRARVHRLLAAGVDFFLDLTAPGEVDDYERWLPGPYGREPVDYVRKPIRDHDLPEHAGQMAEILDELDAALAEGRRIYLHCRAGIGRTNLVVGCWLVRRGLANEPALAELNRLWGASARSADWPTVPETAAQVDYVRAWRESRPAVGRRPATGAALSLQDRCRGLLLGLAAGDACGQPAAQRRPGTFTPIGDLLGGGPFDLPRGAWSDETAMALCLAESLVDDGGVDLGGQVRRYQRWQRQGYLSSTGECVGISAETARALAQAQWTGNPVAGSHDPARPSKEPLARLGPVVAWRLADPAAAIDAAVECSRVTHQAPITLDAVRYFAALLNGALRGLSKVELLAPMFSPLEGYWDRHRLKPEVEAVARGAWRDKAPPLIFGGGQAVAALEATLWSFARAGSFRETVLAAVNLGGDADTTGAIVGQLAGAHYGAAAIPRPWRAGLVAEARILELADALAAAGRR